MYESYWGLTESPFSNGFDTRCYYESPGHEEGLARILYLVEQQRHCAVLRGPAGVGKSLLFAVANESLSRSRCQLAVVDLFGLDGEEVLVGLAGAIRLGVGESESSLRLWRCLDEHFAGAKFSQTQTVIFFDHLERAKPNCTPVLERILHLTDQHSGAATMVFSARQIPQTSLGDVLSNCSDFRIELSPLDFDETSKYVSGRLQQAGCDGQLFDADALVLLFERSGGVPRDVNRLCDLSLLAGMVQGEKRIDVGIVDAVSRELQDNAWRDESAERFADVVRLPNA